VIKKKRTFKWQPNDMNILYIWDNGMTFDTRNKKGMLAFTGMVFNYGLPTKYEIRG